MGGKPQQGDAVTRRFGFSLLSLPAACSLVLSVVAAALLGCAIVLPASARAEEPNLNQVMSADYTGAVSLYHYAPPMPNYSAWGLLTADLHFNMSVAYSLAQVQTTTVYWQITELQGEVHYEGEGEEGKKVSCSGTFYLNPAMVHPGEIPGIGAFILPYGYGEEPFANNFTVTPPGGVPTAAVAGHATPGAGGYSEACEVSFSWLWNADEPGTGNGNPWSWASFLGEDMSNWAAAAAPTVYFPRTGTYTQPVNYSYTCAPPSCGTESEGSTLYGKAVNTIESSITFSSGSGEVIPPSQPGPNTAPTSSSPSTTPPPKNTDPSKHDAALDIPDAIKAAEPPCAAAAIGSVAAASDGGLLTSMIGGPSASQQVGKAGQAVLSSWGPLCDEAIKRIEQDWKIASDPAAASWHALAQPAKARAQAGPSCKRLHGERKSLCELTAAQSAVVSASRRVAAVDEAIETTISRQTAALDAGEQSAASAQEAHAVTLQGEFDKDLNTETRDEATRTKDLRDLGVRIALTKKLKSKALHLMLGRLASAGVSEADLEAYAGGTLTMGNARIGRL
jgi:hypothetical protein